MKGRLQSGVVDLVEKGPKITAVRSAGCRSAGCVGLDPDGQTGKNNVMTEPLLIIRKIRIFAGYDRDISKVRPSSD